ncbi:hypothetical protein [Haloquadratum walsbyi]|jgi:hypothetical protein|nr:hypothetical protein [Haloquadratum walsbyi]
MSKATKRIPLREGTFEDLDELKGAGETWDDVVKELIETKQMETRVTRPN